MRATIGTLDRGLDEELTSRLGRARGHAAGSRRVAPGRRGRVEEAAATGLEAIAKAYEGWLRAAG